MVDSRPNTSTPPHKQVCTKSFRRLYGGNKLMALEASFHPPPQFGRFQGPHLAPSKTFTSPSWCIKRQCCLAATVWDSSTC